MSPLAKAAAGAGTLSVIGGGGYLAYDNLIDTGIRVLVDSGKFKETYKDTNLFGAKYGRYLVDPESSKNKEWWSGAFGRWSTFKVQDGSASKLNDAFKNDEKVKRGFGSVETDLNKVCEVAYKKSETDIKNTSNTNYEDNVWQFCSLLEGKPKFIGDNEYTNQVGKDHKDKAVSVTSTDKQNNSFWDLRNKEFFGNRNAAFKGDKSSNGTVFRDLLEGKNNVDTVKAACKKAYETDKTNGTSTPTELENDIKKFCYLVPEPAQS
ncbi:hypothetical protein [Candidatus Mycoplasma haematohominis]|uniref:hypothetical protein n=1 Tax=Candidatus Mycoplasma haematohominis TaxID=1494318 RepID=UPI001C0A6CA3|nr:hypothetical protein [Candidatus Mycoplasma haemohominis]